MPRGISLLRSRSCRNWRAARWRRSIAAIAPGTIALVAQAARDLRDCDLIALAQYSMAPAAALVAEASGRPVLTTPDSAVLKLRQLLAAG